MFGRHYLQRFRDHRIVAAIKRRLRRHKPLMESAAPKPWDEVAAAARKNGLTYIRDVGDGVTLARYEKDGHLDYDTYRAVQEAGNKAKLDWVFATEATIALIAEDARRRSETVEHILCHGTRNGAEQRWFRQHFPDADILGTEISETATQFEMTIRWDFHDIKDGWSDHWDLIYSNSWDHTYDPHKMFSAWARCLRPGKLLYLEHTKYHELVNHLDLFGATPLALRKMVESCGLRYFGSLGSPERSVLMFSKDQSG